MDQQSFAVPRAAVMGCFAGISVALVLLAGIADADLSSDEAAMLSWVDAHAGELEAFVERSVNINSGTMNFAGVREVGGMLQAEYEALGFATEWIDLSELNRAGHLFARHTGEPGRTGAAKILLIGHLDTVFEAGDSFTGFSREADGIHARGPGSADMKSGNAVMLYALQALDSIGALAGLQIVAAYTGDEENPARPFEISRRPLIEAGIWADIALGFELGSREAGIDQVTIARRGSSRWLLEVSGRQSHSSLIFSDDVGAGAIFEVSRILSEFYESVRGEPYLTFNAGTILGGTDVDYDIERTQGAAFGKTNVVPQHVVVHGGLRTISADQLERARSRMREIVGRHLPQTDARIAFSDGYPAMAPTAGNRRLQALLSAINVDLGGGEIPAVDPSRRGAADISFVAPYTDGLDGLGGSGGGAHSPGERLDLSSLPTAVKRAAILIYRSANGER